MWRAGVYGSLSTSRPIFHDVGGKRSRLDPMQNDTWHIDKILACQDPSQCQLLYVLTQLLGSNHVPSIISTLLNVSRMEQSRAVASYTCYRKPQTQSFADAGTFLKSPAAIQPCCTQLQLQAVLIYSSLTVKACVQAMEHD